MLKKINLKLAMNFSSICRYACAFMPIILFGMSLIQIIKFASILLTAGPAYIFLNTAEFIQSIISFFLLSSCAMVSVYFYTCVESWILEKQLALELKRDMAEKDSNSKKDKDLTSSELEVKS